MDINNVFGQPEVIQKEETYKAPAISPFDFINAINFDKKDLIVDDWSEKQYIPYIVNRGLSFGADTVIPANEMNSRPHLDRKLQFDFLINTVRPRKRYNKWVKADKVEAIEVVKTYYGYSIEKARQALSILTSEQLDHLKQKLEKGGL
jgi:hypothetical protein